MGTVSLYQGGGSWKSFFDVVNWAKYGADHGTPVATGNLTVLVMRVSNTGTSSAPVVNFRIDVNGDVQQTTKTGSGLASAGDIPIYIGNGCSVDTITYSTYSTITMLSNFLLHEMRYYDRELTDDEITSVKSLMFRKWT